MPNKIEHWACEGCTRIYKTEEECRACEALCLLPSEIVKTAKVSVHPYNPTEYNYNVIRDEVGCPLEVDVTFTINGVEHTRTYHR